MKAITACLWLFLLLQVQFVTANNKTRSHKHGLFGIVAKQAVELQKQASQLEKQENQLQQLSQKLQSLETKMENQQHWNSPNLTALEDMRSKQVVFSATYKDYWTDLNVGTRGTLKFNYIINNLGNGYNPHTGHFTAPYSGHYAFYARISLSENYGYVTLAIYKGHSTQLAIVTVRDLSVWDKDTAFVTTHLNKGEVVLVRIREGGTVINAGQYTTFSGMLVAAD